MDSDFGEKDLKPTTTTFLARCIPGKIPGPRRDFGRLGVWVYVWGVIAKEKQKLL